MGCPSPAVVISCVCTVEGSWNAGFCFMHVVVSDEQRRRRADIVVSNTLECYASAAIKTFGSDSSGVIVWH